MTDQTGRGPNGKFARGNAGGPGRPRRETEREYLEAISEVVKQADWRRIVRKAKDDAIAGDAKARDWLGKYLIGDAARDDTGTRRLGGSVRIVIPDNGRDGIDADDMTSEERRAETTRLLGILNRHSNGSRQGADASPCESGKVFSPE